MDEQEILTRPHCSVETKETRDWKRCNKCSFIWCPGCSKTGNQCANCIGGELLPIPDPGR